MKKMNEESPCIAAARCDAMMSRLLHPSPLVKAFQYWNDGRGGQPVMCEARLDELCDDQAVLEASGLELMTSLRLLQEVRQLGVMSIAPFVLNVSDGWMQHRMLMELLARAINFPDLPHPLVLRVSFLGSGADNPALYSNMRAMRSGGCQFILNSGEVEGTRRWLSELCDGVRYQLSELIDDPGQQTQLLRWRHQGKYIQIGGVAPCHLPLAITLGGDHFCAPYS